VTINGSLAVVGAPSHAHPQLGAGIGAAYVFQRSLLCSSGIWCEQLLLLTDNNPPATFPQWGTTVSLSGDTAIIGGPSANTQGAFMVFEDVPDCP
jgi:hypothetical protein